MLKLASLWHLEVLFLVFVFSLNINLLNRILHKKIKKTSNNYPGGFPGYGSYVS